MTVIPVILSGGSGSRLWPVSRTGRPKQLVALAGRETLLQQTALRAQAVAVESDPIVICNREHRFEVAEQLHGVGAGGASILLEPCGRNTAPAIAVAALHARAHGDDPVLLVLPSDHLLENTEAFAAAVDAGLGHAESGALMTFGVKPTEPATGYGYIRAAGPGVAGVAGFTEKPARELAEQYLQAGDYYWNSGMFMFRAGAFLDALAEFAPEMLAACREAFESLEADPDFVRIPEAVFARCPADSIDYAVMEKTSKAMVVPLDAGWSDLGSWRSLWEVGTRDADGNVLLGDALTHQAAGCYIRAESRLVTAVGVDDHIIVETADAVLVAHKNRSEDIKQLVEQLRERGRPEVDRHKQVRHPWGTIEVIDETGQIGVRRLIVNPGAALALQAYESMIHWIAVRGTADVLRTGERVHLEAGESICIPPGADCGLENPGSTFLELIEIRSGDVDTAGFAETVQPVG